MRGCGEGGVDFTAMETKVHSDPCFAKRVPVALLLLFSMISIAHAQSSFLYQPKSLSQNSWAQNKSFISNNCNKIEPFASLVGKKVVFIAKSKMFRDNGYSRLNWADGSDHYLGIPYHTLAGKVGVIQSIGPAPAMPTRDDTFRHVYIKLQGTKKLIVTDALNGAIPDVTLLSDIEYGRKRWVGKTLWYRSNKLRTSMGEASAFDGKTILKYQPVVVVNVLVGVDNANSVAFLVKMKDGTQGLVTLTLSASNTSPGFLHLLEKLDHKECSFDQKFMTSDPRKKYKWSPQTWDAIENSQVLIGMSVRQVIMAWGHPDQINSTDVVGKSEQQWVYNTHQYVYFDDDTGNVVAVQQ